MPRLTCRSRRATAGPNAPRLRWVPVYRLHALRRNPQYLSPHELSALEASIRRDGFLVPILCRPRAGGGYEILSGNHRVLAARRLGLARIPALIAGLSDAQAARLAVNLNTVHGQPPAVLLAPYLAGLEPAALATLHMPEPLRRETRVLQQVLRRSFAQHRAPGPWNQSSPRSRLPGQINSREAESRP